MNKIVDISTEHSTEIKTLFEVLKENLNEAKIDMIRDENQKTSSDVKSKNKSNKSSKSSDTESESEQESDSESDKKKSKSKKNKKEKLVDKKKKNKEKDSDSDGEKKNNDKAKNQNSTGGIRMLALDEHQTLLIYVKLNADQFVNFYVKPPIHSIGLDLIQFHRFMKTVDKDSTMRIYIDKDDEQNIVFELQNNVKNNNVIYKQKLLDIDDHAKKLPSETNFEMSVMMDTADFRKICAEMAQFSEYVEITCTRKEITFKCQGDSNAYIKIFKNSDTGVRIISLKNDNNKQPNIVQAIYNLKHLVTFGKCVNLCTEMQLYLKNDYPLFIHYYIGRLGKMLVGLSPVDEKTIKKDNDYDENNDKYYNDKKATMKEM